MNNIQFHPSVIGWFITVVLFVIGYVFAFIRQNGKNEAHYEELRREIERLTRTDIELMEKNRPQHGKGLLKLCSGEGICWMSARDLMK